MLPQLRQLAWIVIAATISITIGCSSSATAPVTPGDTDPLGGPDISAQAERVLWGQWEIAIDLSNPGVDVIPVRNGSSHFNITTMLFPPNCPDCLVIKILQFKPAQHYIELEVALRNPAGFNAYDVRGIMMPKAAGVELVNADSYTDLWDDGGLVTVNPFKAFATDQPKRKFAAHTTHKRIYQINYPDFKDLMHLALTVDASWPGNCREPYAISDIDVTGTFSGYEKRDINCRVQSWFGDIKSVSVLADESLGYKYPVEMTPAGGDWWEAKDIYWHEGGNDPGDYKLMILAKTWGSAIYLINYVDITIGGTTDPKGWASTFGYWGNDRPYAVEVDNLGNIILGGKFDDSVDFDPGPDSYELTSNGGRDIFLAKYETSGDIVWARGWGGTYSSYEERIDSIAIGEDNAIYAAGAFRGDQVDFDPGPLVDEHTSESYDAFLVKFDTNGYLHWARTWGGPVSGSDEAFGVCLDGSGNVYVAGRFTGTADFDPGDGVEEYTAISGSDAFLSSFDTEGNFRWARTWGGSGDWDGDDYAMDVAPDASGHVYITGLCRGTIDFDPGPGVAEYAANGTYSDTFLVCVDGYGEYVWGRGWGGTGTEEGHSVAVDANGNIYVGGIFYDICDFDPGPDSLEIESKGYADSFVSKFNPTGVFQWVRNWGGISNEDLNDIAVDGGALYAAGIFQSSVDFAADQGEDIHTSMGYSDCCFVKYDPEGNYLWARTIGGDGSDYAGGVAPGLGNSLFFAGAFTDLVDFLPGPGTDLRYYNGGTDIFLMKFTKDGTW